MSESEVKNASQFPKRFFARHMQPGVCGYNNETILVDTDALKQMLGNDAVGKPVYVLHQQVDLDKLQEKAAGYITNSFYNELDGWGWFELLAINDECHKAISLGWKVSNAYVPVEWARGGTKNNVPFDREIVNGQFTHLAIVPNPRYEDACIMTPEQFKAYQDSKKRELEELRNSKPEPSKGFPMFKFLKRQDTVVTNAEEATHVEIDGKLVTAEEAKAILNAKKNTDDADVDAQLDNMVDCDGEKMTVREMKNRLTKMNSEKKNADEEAKKKADEEKANAEEKAKKDEEEKANALADEAKKKAFDELQNAHLRNGAQSSRIIETGIDKLARGKISYGTPEK